MYEPRIPKFNGNPNEDFPLWSMRVKTALRSRELATALDADQVESGIDEKAMYLIITS